MPERFKLLSPTSHDGDDESLKAAIAITINSGKRSELIKP
jgi:hypothetical protein